MKLIKFLLKMLLPILMLALTLSFVLESITVKTITEKVMSKKVSEYVLDNVIIELDVDVDALEKLEQEIRTSDYAERITSKYIETVINNVIYEKSESLNIESEIAEILENDYFSEFSEEKKTEIKNSLEQRSIDLERELEENLPTSFGNFNVTIVLKVYDVCTDISFRVTMLMLLVINIICLVLLEKVYVLKSIQISLVIISIISLIIFICLKLGLNILNQHFFGGLIGSVNLNMLMFLILVEFLVSMVLYSIRKKVIKSIKS